MHSGGAKVDGARDNHNARLIGILFYIARSTILRFWISKGTPTMDDCYKEALRILPLEKLISTLQYNVGGFIKIWFGHDGCFWIGLYSAN